MKYTVALNCEFASRVAQSGEAPDLRALVAGDEVEVVKVFGRGRFVDIVASREAYEVLKSRLAGTCVFTPAVSAKPF